MHTSRPPLTPFFTAGTRSPALVTLPGRNAPRGARLVRLRVRDRPGSLAAVTGHLAQYGVDVIRVEVLNRESGWAIDDLLVTGHELDEALATLDRNATVLADRLEVNLLDPGIAMANACASVTAAGTAREACRNLVRSALELVFAEEEGILHVRNAPSPAATACLAIAETIADRLDS